MTNQSKPKHTPLPWRLGIKDSDCIIGKDDLIVAWSRFPQVREIESNIANAAYIVKAVNNHEALRDALETLMLYAENCESHPEYLQLLKVSE
jgi:hypothetical protein